MLTSGGSERGSSVQHDAERILSATATGRADPALRRMVFFVFDGMSLPEVMGPAEVLAAAARRGAPYDVCFASLDGRQVVAAQGVVVPVRLAVADAGAVDTVFVPGGDPASTGETDLRVVWGLLARRQLRARRVVGTATGEFILGAVGLLGGRPGTVQWQHAATVAARFLRTEPQPLGTLVQDGEVFTVTTPSAATDLALMLLEHDHGRNLAAAVAHGLGLPLPTDADPTTTPSYGAEQVPARAGTGPTSSVLLKVLALIQADPGGAHTVSGLARAVGISPRDLTRLFRDELDTTPQRHLEQVRFSLARTCLDQGDSVAETALRSGYGSTAALRRAFIARLGEPPSNYRVRRALSQAAKGESAAVPS